MSRTHEIRRLLGIRHPIVQAPMVGVSTPQLAAVVSEAGALGSIGLGASNAAQAQELIRATRALTAAPFNVNLFCHRPAVADAAREAAWLEYLAPIFAEFGAQPPAALSESYRSFLACEDTQEVLLRERPAVVSFHFGLPPQEWIRALKDAGMVTLACVTSLEEAAQAEQAGVDALVAQGVEAGGHRGVFEPERDLLIGTFALTALIASHSRLPVIAAGGIMDGRGIAAALQLGAAAVQMGTAFVLCPESSANAQYRAALGSERARHTRISAAISGRPARGMVNRLFDELDAADAPTLPDYPIAYDAAKALVAAAVARGCHDFAVQWAGQGAPLARAMPAAELVETLVRELQEAGVSR
jgi:nitronate monooxygenase